MTAKKYSEKVTRFMSKCSYKVSLNDVTELSLQICKKKRYQHQILSSASSLIKYHELNFLEMLENENLHSRAANFIRVRLIQMFKCNYLIFEKQFRKVVKSYIKAATEMSKLLESHGLANWGIL